MNISLTPELARFVTDKVSSGLYSSASEVVREGLRLLLTREHGASEASRAEIRRKIEEGLADAEAGRLVEGKTLFAELRKRSRARRRS